MALVFSPLQHLFQASNMSDNHGGGGSSSGAGGGGGGDGDGQWEGNEILGDFEMQELGSPASERERRRLAEEEDDARGRYYNGDGDGDEGGDGRPEDEGEDEEGEEDDEEEEEEEDDDDDRDGDGQEGDDEEGEREPRADVPPAAADSGAVPAAAHPHPSPLSHASHPSRKSSVVRSPASTPLRSPGGAAEVLFTQKEILALRLMFSLFDRSGQNTISHEDLVAFAEETGDLAAIRDAAPALEVLDIDGDGVIGLLDFIAFAARLKGIHQRAMSQLERV